MWIKLPYRFNPCLCFLGLVVTGSPNCGVFSGFTCSQANPPKFLSTTPGCGTSPFHLCAPPTSLDGCDSFNSLVVRLPSNLIPNASEWWLFHILVVILMWLYEKASHLCLNHHLDWNSPNFFWVLKWFFSCFLGFRNTLLPFLPSTIFSWLSPLSNARSQLSVTSVGSPSLVILSQFIAPTYLLSAFSVIPKLPRKLQLHLSYLLSFPIRIWRIE